MPFLDATSLILVESTLTTFFQGSTSLLLFILLCRVSFFYSETRTIVCFSQEVTEIFTFWGLEVVLVCICSLATQSQLATHLVVELWLILFSGLRLRDREEEELKG
jgi:hypothetical protein